MKTIKLNLLLIIISLTFYSCIIDDYESFNDANIKFITYWKDDIFNSQDFKNSILVDGDTLSLKDFKYVISDLKLTSEKDTINIIDYKLMKGFNNFNIDNITNDVYKISFNFGIENINDDFSQLKAQNFDIENGYYFMKMSFKKKNRDSLYNYNIAKKSISSRVKSFKIIIDGFQPSKGYFISEAVIGLNLKNLLTNPNLISLDSLSSNSLDNENLQLQMIENSKNIFYLERFNYD